MPLNDKKVLVLGSGGLRIGQAGEFDYSGSQAIKALKEEGIQTILLNPNIATVQTDSDMADKVYLQPLNVKTVVSILEKERPTSILLSVGGQTALNLGLELYDQKILERYSVEVLGTTPESIRMTEDRDLFKEALSNIGVATAKSFLVTSVEKALEAAKIIGFPLMLRSGYSLGGLGSGVLNSEKTLQKRAEEALSVSPQILIEESLLGYKEIEVEIVRDQYGNGLTVCFMENIDPMGIHTGESIVCAPTQTLNDKQVQTLRTCALKCASLLKIVGECNIQYAIHPETGKTYVVEMNARLSRSSALASKATGYPLAFISTKLALGYALSELKNCVTKKTTAFFEPALDYIAVKIPRWDMQKLPMADRKIGTEMKSVGEVMALGKTFEEALQKAVRMLNIGCTSLSDYPYPIENPEGEIKEATDRRLFALTRFFLEGGSIERAHELSKIDRFYLDRIKRLSEIETSIKDIPLTEDSLLFLKKAGFSDALIAKKKSLSEENVRSYRKKHKIIPHVLQIDTLAGEFDAETNYLYLTYHAEADDLLAESGRSMLLLGSGPYCIGSSVEFDWCLVNCARELRGKKIKTIVINSNPETVSTDFDESDRLYFEELTLERVLDIAEFECPEGIIVSFGGQIANNLAKPLSSSGFHVMGTDPCNIDAAENRNSFSKLLQTLAIDQPSWTYADTLDRCMQFAKDVSYPVLLRPSYVLSGSAMSTVFSDEELIETFKEALIVSKEHPVVVSKFIQNGKEIEIDGVAKDGEVIVHAISEHIENAGVHSGDAHIVLPPQRLYLETIRQVKRITKKIIQALSITGPFNIQFIAFENMIKVIECNVRASRSLPFVSKVTATNLVRIATRAMLGEDVKGNYQTLDLDYVSVKAPQFSYNRLKGSNPVTHTEMASTGEVAIIADNLHEAFFRSWTATEQTIKGKNVLLSIGGDKKVKLLPSLIELNKLGYIFFATEHTHAFLQENGIPSTFIEKASTKREPSVTSLIINQGVDLIINIPRTLKQKRAENGSLRSDGFVIRRLAIDYNIPLITNLQIAFLLLECVLRKEQKTVEMKSLCDYVKELS